MQAALKGLGALDTNERIRRFISTLPYEGDEQLDHDVDCVCPGCERQKGMYPSLPSFKLFSCLDMTASLVVHRLNCSAWTPKESTQRAIKSSSRYRRWLGAALGTCRCRATFGERLDGHPGKACRRRPLDENARRGESKLGRVAHLRPGRITLGPERKLKHRKPN